MLQNQEDAEDECDLDEDEELDPRVQDELERLNSCTDEINQVSPQRILVWSFFLLHELFCSPGLIHNLIMSCNVSKPILIATTYSLNNNTSFLNIM